MNHEGSSEGGQDAEASQERAGGAARGAPQHRARVVLLSSGWGLCYTPHQPEAEAGSVFHKGAARAHQDREEPLITGPAEHWSHMIIKLDLIVGFLNNSLPPPNAAKPHGPTAP